MILQDLDSAAVISIGFSIITGVISYGIGQGSTQEKLKNQAEEISELKDRINDIRMELKEEQKGFVTTQVFEAAMRPISKSLDNLEHDVKDLLRQIKKQGD